MIVETNATNTCTNKIEADSRPFLKREVMEKTQAKVRAILELFSPGVLPSDLLDLIAERATWLSIRGGNHLFRKDEPSDAVYFLATGSLAIVDGKTIRSRILPGQMIGHVGCIDGGGRPFDVIAHRTSELIMVPWKDIEEISRTNPKMMTEISRAALKKARELLEGRIETFSPHCFALVAGNRTVDMPAMAERLQKCFANTGNVKVLSVDDAAGLDVAEFAQFEKQFDYLVYICDEADKKTSRRFVRNSDIQIVVGDGSAPNLDFFTALQEFAGNRITHLILDWNSEVRPEPLHDWLDGVKPDFHHHCRNFLDAERIARLLTGRGLGLVLSGGGARGIAHIGVIKALRENNIPVDLVIGASIGSLVGAGIALEWDDQRLTNEIDLFSKRSLFLDVTFPKKSFLSGRMLRKFLTKWFGDTTIEELPIPYASVSSNIHTGTVSLNGHGDLKTWVAASTAIPGVFPPVSDEGIVHVDGGVLNNMPTDLIGQFGVNRIIAVDVGGGAQRDRDREDVKASQKGDPNLLELLMRVATLGHAKLAAERSRQCDVLVVPDLATISFLDFKAFREAIDAGYRAAIEQIDDIKGVALDDGITRQHQKRLLNSPEEFV